MGDLRVRVLGGLELEGADAGSLGSRKARTLIKVLALARRRPVTAERLADALWPEGGPARPADQVSVLISRCRAACGAERIVRTDAGYALLTDWLDVDALGELVDEADRLLASGSTTAARVAARAALALARGPLLPDEIDAPWAEGDRALADRLLARARATAAAAALAAGDPVAAADLAAVAMDHDPFDEHALRILMEAHARAGRPASALAAYARVREQMVDELGVSPSPATEELHRAILLAEPVAAADASATEVAVVAAPGREHELAVLDMAADVGDGRLLIVEGEPGIGKSRLLDAWATRVAARGALVLRGQCEELARGLPLQAVVDAIDSHLRSLAPETAEAVLGLEAVDLAPYFDRRSAAPTGSIDQPLGQLLVFRGILGVLGRLAAAQPVVLIIDDLHLAGPLTAEWLHFATRHASGMRLSLLAAVRPAESTPIPGAQTLRLGPLDLTATAAIVGADRAADLYARSGGHPLFLVELASSDASDALPSSITEAVATAADRAGPEVAATLRAAAVLGEDVDLDLLAATLAASPVALIGHLEEGARRDLLVERDDGFAFRHSLVREALADGTSASRRALLHRQAGRVLAARPGADPLAIAHHARLGGDLALAAKQLIAAAATASSLFDQAEAARLVDESLTLGESAEARVMQARIALLTGAYDDALAVAERAYSLGGGAAAREVGAWAAHYLRRPSVAIRLADEGAEVAADDNERAACLTIAGWVRDTTGEIDAAETNLREARHIGRGAVRSMASAWLGGLLVHRSRVDEGLALLAEPVAASERLHGYPSLHAHLFGALGYGTAGRVEEALAVLDRLDEEVARFAALRWAGRADNVRGWIIRNVGGTAEADEHNQRAAEAALEIHMSEPLCHAYLDLASGAILAGDADRAAELVTLADDPKRPWHALQWRHQLRSLLLRGRVALERGDPTGASEAAAQVLQEAERVQLRRYEVFAGLLSVQARIGAGDTVDLDETGRLLEALPAVAGLEAWWLTADVAHATANPAFRVLAERRIAELAARAGPRRDGFVSFARARLGP